MTLLSPAVPVLRRAVPSWEDGALRMHVDFRRRPVRLELAGDLDLAAAQLLRSVLSDLLEADGAVLVVDVTRLAFVDCAGLDPLVRAERQARTSGRRLEVGGRCPALARLVDALPALWPACWQEQGAA